MNLRWRGSMLVVVSAVSFGLMPIFARFAYSNGVGVQELLFVRFLLAFVVIGIFLRLTGRFSVPSRNHLFALWALGGIGYFLQSTFYFTALKYVPVSVDALVLNTYPAFVTGGSLTLGWERFSFSVILSLLFALVGLVLVVNPVLNVALVGVSMAFGAAITYTVYILLSSRVLKGVCGDVGSFYVIGAASLSFGAFGLLSGGFGFAWASEAWMWVLAISLMSTSLAVTAFFEGLKMVGPSRASILSTGELVTSVVAASAIFNETLSILQLVGGLLILSAAVFAARS